MPGPRGEPAGREGGDRARFHWFTHFFVGTSVALLVMAGVAGHIRRPVPLPLLWFLLAQVVAMFSRLSRGGRQVLGGGAVISPPLLVGTVGFPPNALKMTR